MQNRGRKGPLKKEMKNLKFPNSSAILQCCHNSLQQPVDAVCSEIFGKAVSSWDII